MIVMMLFCSVQNMCFGSEGFDYVDAGKHRHDGFYFQIAGGYAGTAMGEQVGEDLYIYSGPSANAKIGIGYALVENFILSLDIAGFVLSQPELQINGEDEGELDTEFTNSKVGLGMTYYFMPSNVYLSGSGGLAVGWVENDQEIYNTGLGYGISGGIGKEWWVGDNWGLGVGFHVDYYSLPVEFSNGEVSHYTDEISLALMVSATFN